MFDADDPAPGYALVWPKDLLRRELSFLYTGWHLTSDLASAVEWLFTEAFAGPDPVEDVAEARRSGNPWSTDELDRLGGVLKLAKDLLDHLEQLPEHQRKQYYRERTTRSETPPAAAPSADDRRLLQEQWTRMLADLDEHGYFDRRAGDRCTDGCPEALEDHNRVMTELIAERCHIRPPWPIPAPNENLIADGVFFTFAEVLHDLVARPRNRWWHEYCEEHHYGEFDQRAGQAVYRWKVNKLLEAHLPEYRLAEEGEDTGLIVTTVPDPRAELEQAVVHDVPDGNADRVGHAIALFRRRGASVEDKRSACKALADVLENRRKLIRAELLKKDEGAIFQIANEFWIRHHDGRQHTDYAQGQFLDWVFWTYLATVELTNRLLARDTPAAS